MTDRHSAALTHTWFVVVASKGTLLCSYLGPCWGTWGSTWYAGYWSCSKPTAPEVRQGPDLWLGQLNLWSSQRRARQGLVCAV